MVTIESIKKYCDGDYSKIENYEQAVSDKTQVWHLHHKAEILPCGIFYAKDLKKFGLYYNRPPEELIFLTQYNHRSLHSKNLKKESRVKQGSNKCKHFYTNGQICIVAYKCPKGFRPGIARN